MSSYIPVSCDLVDQIEIFATSRKVISLEYIQDENRVSELVMLKTWYTKKSVEYLETMGGLVIRLDNVLSIDGIANSGACSF